MTSEAKESPESLQEVLFDLAVQKPTAADRAAFLDGVCRDSPDLRATLERLLSVHFGEAGFLPMHQAQQSGAIPAPPPPTPPPESPMIGRYKLLEKIGEGGFGEVWMAEQREPVKRRVALKIIKLGMDTRQIVARFEAERQALALMDHPNIARVFDAGATDTGRPYFVMELVRGAKITEYCDKNALPAKERLKLFILVCQAIQHAHQKGIIHRDIKPSNILVTLHDGVPVPKVIDFGIAKATQGELTDKTLFTQFQQFIGTPAYISPEQAEMSGLDIDTRADIYSLGVLLYELLVGQTPFDAAEMLKGGLDALRQIIREREPVRPSTRLTQQLVAADLTRRKSTHELAVPTQEEINVDSRWRLRLKEQIALLRGDLDWIVMKCLEKDRNRRYETANALAMDVQRYLARELVLARPPSAAYKIQKAWQRNKLAFTSAALVVLALLVGTGVSTWQAARATKAQKSETQQRIVAQAAQSTAQARQKEAEAQRAIAQRTAYNASMSSIQADWEKRNYPRIRETLASQKDYPDRSFEWFYWQRMMHLESSSFPTYANGIRSYSLSRDRIKIVLVMKDDSIEIRSLPSGEKLATFLGHSDFVSAAAFSPDGRLVASCGGDFLRGVIKLWDAATGKEIRSFGQFTDPADLNGRDGLEQKVGNRQYGITFSPDGRFLATGGAHGKYGAQIWDVATGRKVQSLEEGNDHFRSIIDLAFLNEGKRLLCNAEKTVRLYDVQTGEQLDAIGGQSPPAMESGDPPGIRMAVSPDSQRLAVDRSGTVRIYDLTAKGFSKVLLEITENLPGKTVRLAFSPDGKRLVLSGAGDSGLALSGNGDSVILDSFAGQHQLTLRGGSFASEFLADSRRIISTDGDRRIKIWDASSSHELQRIITGYLPLAIARDGSRLIVLLPQKGLDKERTSRERNTGGLGIFDIATGKIVTEMREHEPELVDGAALSLDGKWAASGGRDGTFRVWDATTGEVKKTVETPQVEHYPIGFGPRGDLIISQASRPPHGLAVWDIASGEANFPPAPDCHEIIWALSPNGHRLATGDYNGNLRIRDAQTGHEIRKWKGHAEQQFTPFIKDSMDYSADGTQVVTGGFDRLVKLWNPETGNLLQTLSGHSAAVVGVRFTPDQRRLISQAQDGTVRIWDRATGKELLALTDPFFENVWTWNVGISPDGRKIFAAAGMKKEMIIWEGASPEHIAAWQREEEADAAQWAAEKSRLEKRRATHAGD